MSRRLALAVLALAAAVQVRAQTPADRSEAQLREDLATLNGQLAVVAAAQARAERASAVRRAGRVYTSGDIALVLWEAMSAEVGHALARRVDSILAATGVLPDAFTRGAVMVMNGSADTASVLAQPGLAGRRRIAIQVPMASANPQPDDWWILGPLLATYAATLDTAWTAWSQNAWGFLRWRPEEAAERGSRDLRAPQFAAADRCMAGHAEGCRRFLGLDDDARPYQARFTAAEVRRAVANFSGVFPGVAPCRLGDDEACLRVIERFPFTGLGAIPASGDSRSGLMAAVVALHGADALRRALADREGSVGERLARASGVSVDSLAMAWRAWALSGGRPYHVRAGVGDLAAALAAVSILVFLATRRGRWM